MLTEESVSQYLSYDQYTGILTWIKRPSNRVRIGDAAGCVKTEPCGNKYLYVGLFGRIHKAHRIAWLLCYGHFPNGYIDHIDGNGLNNRIKNLRDASASDNMKNTKLRSDNNSGSHGISWDRERNKWVAYIGINGKRIQLGRFIKKYEAIAVRKLAEKENGFHKNHGRI